jgi:hypothetical protein
MMDKKLGDFNRGGSKTIIDEGHYKLRTTEFEVVIGKESGAPYVIPHCVVVNPCPQVGSIIQLGFSLSEASESIAAAWLTALGLDEEAVVPMDDADRIQVFLERHCLHAIFEADIVKEKNNRGYMQNSVNPPWGVMASELGKDDKVGPAGVPGGSRGEQPPF